MTVSLRNTPLLASSLGTLTPSITGTYNSTAPVAGDLLVAVLTLQANTTATVANLGAPPAGWALTTIRETSTGVLAAAYVKVAAGSDAAPVFTATLTSTAADCGGEVVIYDFYDSSAATPSLTDFGIAAGTSGTVAPVTASNVAAGSYAVAALSMYAATAAVPTWTTPGGWTSRGDSSASTHYQYAHWSLASPASGATLTCSMAHTVITSTFEAGLVLVVSPPGPLDWFEAHNTGSLTLGWSHTARAGQSAMLAVAANVDIGSDSGVTATATCDGILMLPAGREETSAGAGGGWLQLWQSPVPVTPGSHAVVVTVAGATPTDIIGCSVSSPGSVSAGTVILANDAGTIGGVVVPAIAQGNIVAAFLTSGSAIGSVISPSTTALFTDNLEGSGPNSTGNLSAAYALAGFTGTGALHGPAGLYFSGTGYRQAGSQVVRQAADPVVQAPYLQAAAIYRADAGATLPKGASGPTLVSWTKPGGSFAAAGIEFQQPGPVQILTATLPAAYNGYLYTTALAAQGGTETGYTWSVISGSLPSWATLTASTGVITGTPATSGSSTFTVQVTDSGLNSLTAILTLTSQAFTGYPYITGLLPDPVAGGSFVTQLGTRQFLLLDNPWALPFNAGEWTSGAWQTDMTNYLGYKQAQGYTACYVSALGNIDIGGSYKNGNTWDNLPPLVGGSAPAAPRTRA